MEKIKLEANVRTGSGTEKAKKVRQKGFVPGIIYGKGKTIGIEIGPAAIKILRKARFSETILWEMDLIDGTNRSPVSVLIKDTQYHPVTDSVLHIDFMRVSLTEKIRVHIPVVLIGTAQKVILAEGLVNQVLYELEIDGMPLDLPEKIEIDITNLEINHSIHVGEIKIAENLKIITHAEETIVTAVEKQQEEIAVPAAVDGSAPIEPEIIKEKKDKEGEAGAVEAKGTAKAAAKPDAKSAPVKSEVKPKK